MHKAQVDWAYRIRGMFPQYFSKKRVLDIGSLDVNGNNRHLFYQCEYIGVDVVEGPNVDVVSVAHVFESRRTFDVILSTNAFEHDMYYEKTLLKVVELLREGGLFFFSAGFAYKEHGTKRTSPSDSGTAQSRWKVDKWSSYYKNLRPSDIQKVLNLDKIFGAYSIGVYHRDLRFWGIKRGRRDRLYDTHFPKA
jgi:SAM-dependent methyltransferase